jgi:hypothetical protein
MQVKFSTFIIALSFLTYLFGVVFTSPIPYKSGSPRSSLTRSSSGPATLSSQTHSSRPSSPVQRQATPMAPESPKTRKEWHQERAGRWEEHNKDTAKTARDHGRNALQSARQGDYKKAAVNLGDACLMGMICGIGHITKAVHTHKANKP